jgi:transmembrane sensor
MSDHPPLSPRLWELFERSVHGTLTDVERAELDVWQQSDRRQAELVGCVRHAMVEIRRAAPNAASIMQGLEQRIALEQEVSAGGAASVQRSPQSFDASLVRPSHTQLHTQRPHARRSWRRLTTSVVIAGLGLAAMVYAKGRFVDPAPMSSRETYATGIGESISVTLRDGTRVRLAPRSQLTVASTFGRSERAVVLTGEAYFTVTAHTSTPFVVNTGIVSTRVLGTTFNVRRYLDETQAEVAVADGRVVVTGLGAPVTITAGMIGVVSDSTATVCKVPDLAPALGWTTGNLVFNDAPVPAVLAAVSRWYGYEFRLSDSTLARQHVTAVFKIAEREATMAQLGRVLEVKLKFDGPIVTLLSQSSPPSSSRSRGQARELLSHSTEIGR